MRSRHAYSDAAVTSSIWQNRLLRVVRDALQALGDRMNIDVVGNARGEYIHIYIYIWFILSDKVPNESIMVGEVKKDCTMQTYQ